METLLMAVGGYLVALTTWIVVRLFNNTEEIHLLKSNYNQLSKEVKDMDNTLKIAIKEQTSTLTNIERELAVMRERGKNKEETLYKILDKLDNYDKNIAEFYRKYGEKLNS